MNPIFLALIQMQSVLVRVFLSPSLLEIVLFLPHSILTNSFQGHVLDTQGLGAWTTWTSGDCRNWNKCSGLEDDNTTLIDYRQTWQL